jgi:hypothetical protein
MRLQGNGLFPPTPNMKQSMLFYNGGVTYYSLEMLEDTTVIDYFDRRNGQTVDIQLIDQ